MVRGKAARPLRLLIVTSSWPASGAPYNGSFVREQALALTKTGVDVSVLAPQVFKSDPEESSDGPLRVRRFPFSTEERLLADYDTVPVGRVFSYLLSGRRAAKAEARSWSPDIVHAHFAIPTGPVALALRRRVPVVLTVHRRDIEMALSSGSPVRAVVRWTLSRSDRVFAVSSDMRDKALLLGTDPEKVSVLPMGVDTEVFRPGDKDLARAAVGLRGRSAVVLFCGGLTEVKGVRDLVEAMPAVLAQRDARFVVAGQGPLQVEMLRRADELGVAERISFLGAVERGLMPDLMRSADVLVLPSLSEGLPVVLMEAAASGTPVVATDVGGSSEIASLDPRSRMVPAHDVRALAHALLAVLQTDDVGPGLAGSRFDSRVVVDELRRTYESLARRR